MTQSHILCLSAESASFTYFEFLFGITNVYKARGELSFQDLLRTFGVRLLAEIQPLSDKYPIIFIISVLFDFAAGAVVHCQTVSELGQLLRSTSLRHEHELSSCGHHQEERSD